MDDLESYSKPALMEIAKEMGLKGRYKLKKKQLIELIKTLLLLHLLVQNLQV